MPNCTPYRPPRGREGRLTWRTENWHWGCIKKERNFEEILKKGTYEFLVDLRETLLQSSIPRHHWLVQLLVERTIGWITQIITTENNGVAAAWRDEISCLVKIVKNNWLTDTRDSQHSPPEWAALVKRRISMRIHRERGASERSKINYRSTLDDHLVSTPHVQIASGLVSLRHYGVVDVVRLLEVVQFLGKIKDQPMMIDRNYLLVLIGWNSFVLGDLFWSSFQHEITVVNDQFLVAGWKYRLPYSDSLWDPKYRLPLSTILSLCSSRSRLPSSCSASGRGSQIVPVQWIIAYQSSVGSQNTGEKTDQQSPHRPRGNRVGRRLNESFHWCKSDCIRICFTADSNSLRFTMSQYLSDIFATKISYCSMYPRKLTRIHLLLRILQFLLCTIEVCNESIEHVDYLQWNIINSSINTPFFYSESSLVHTFLSSVCAFASTSFPLTSVLKLSSTSCTK